MVLLAILSTACAPRPSPSATVAPTPAPSSTTAGTAIDCGPVADPDRCDSAVEIALGFFDDPGAIVGSIAIAEPEPSESCPAAPRCIRPAILMRLFGDDGTLLDEIPLLLSSDSWVHVAQVR